MEQNEDVLVFLNSRFPLLDDISVCSSSSGAVKCSWNELGSGFFLHLVGVRDLDDDDDNDDESETTQKKERWHIMLARVEPTCASDVALPSLERVMQVLGACRENKCCSNAKNVFNPRMTTETANTKSTKIMPDLVLSFNSMTTEMICVQVEETDHFSKLRNVMLECGNEVYVSAASNNPKPLVFVLPRQKKVVDPDAEATTQLTEALHGRSNIWRCVIKQADDRLEAMVFMEAHVD